MKHGKKYVDSFKAIDKAKQYDAPEALELAAKGAKAKFDETIELHIRLGVDSRHADQQVRGAVVLPNGTGDASDQNKQLSSFLFVAQNIYRYLFQSNRNCCRHYRPPPFPNNTALYCGAMTCNKYLSFPHL